jgi:hypothetical protein
MKKYHDIQNARIEHGVLTLIVDGKEVKKDISLVSELLSEATEEEKSTFEVSPSGYGIHWPLIDEDISIDGLLGLLHSPRKNKKSA